MSNIRHERIKKIVYDDCISQGVFPVYAEEGSEATIYALTNLNKSLSSAAKFGLEFAIGRQHRAGYQKAAK